MVGVHDMNPFVHRHATGARNVGTGEVALHLHMRRALEMHHHFSLLVLIAPRQHPPIRLLGPEPRLGAVRAGAGRIIRNLVAAENPLPARQVPGVSDDATGGRRADVLRLQRADLVLHRPAHVPHAEVTVGLVEHR